MDKDNAEVFEIDLLDLWRVFIQKVWIILLITVICSAAYFAYDRLTFDPQYESTATMYILRQGSDRESYMEQFASQLNTDFTMAMNVVTDCTYLLTDKKVVNRVIDELNLKMDYEELSKAITITNPTDTRILKIQVKADSPKKARKIVNKLCTVGAEDIREAMGVGQANFYAKGVYDPDPCNQTPKKRYLMVALIAAILSYMYFVIRFLLDDGIHSEEDVEKYLGLTVLAEIPDIHGSSRQGRYGQYGSYGYGYGYGAPNGGSNGTRPSALISRQNNRPSASADSGDTSDNQDRFDGNAGYYEESWNNGNTGEYGTDGMSGRADADLTGNAENPSVADGFSQTPDVDDYSRFAPPSEGETADQAGTTDVHEEEGRY